MKKIAAFIAVITLASAAYSDVLLTGQGTFGAENFNSLATSGTANAWANDSTIANWYAGPATYRASAGTDNTGGLYSYGTNVITDRALGALSSGSTSPVFGVVLRNTSGTAINLGDIRLSFFGEQWRQTANAQSLTASYRISASAFTEIVTGSWTAQANLNFASLQTGTAGPIDGNAAANRTQFTDVAVDSTGTLADGEYLAIRWQKSGTTAPGLAIDDFSVTVVPEPSSLALMGLAAAGLFLARRKVRA